MSAAGVILTGFFVEDSFEAILRRVFQEVIFSSLINLKMLPLKEKYRFKNYCIILMMCNLFT